MSLELVRSYGVALRVGPPALGLRRFGVPPGGAFDRESSLLANALAGAAEEAECWELGMANAVFRASERGTVAVVGAPVAVSVDGRIVPSQSCFPVFAGAEIHIPPPDNGARVFVSFAPGERGRVRRLAATPSSLGEGVLRVVRGPQWGHLQTPSPALSLLQGEGATDTYGVGISSNRVGIRLEGTLAPHEIELPSEPACMGAIQVTREGSLLVLGPDGPTIGGYPKLAVVIDADLDRLGQLRPGDKVSFEEVSLEAARQLRTERRDRLKRQIAEVEAGVRY